jgi:hypothetical protein
MMIPLHTSFLFRLVMLLMISSLLLRAAEPGPAPWRSSLYPEDWTPPRAVDFYKDAFLQDFSTAGYQRGERVLPQVEGPVFDVRDHGADPEGLQDSTPAIQAAIDAAGKAGGGVVWLGEGTFRVAPAPDALHALWIQHPNVVLRGAGSGKTFLFNPETRMHNRSVLRVGAADGGNWRREETLTAIREDLRGPTSVIPVEDLGDIRADDWVVLRADATEAFIADLSMRELWGNEAARLNLGGPLFYRQVLRVDAEAKKLHIDAPIRFVLLRRDQARVSRTPPLLENVGLEGFSLGNAQHPQSGKGWGEEDYRNENLPAHDAHFATLVSWRGAQHGWMRDVASYRPAGNSLDVHMLSNGVDLCFARGITLENVRMSRPQYGGGGGNGYMIRFSAAQECLALDCEVSWNRHGFVFSGMQTSGNVIRGGRAAHTGWQGEGGRTNGRGSDHHMHLSQSNLIDSVQLDRDFFQAAWRGRWGNTAHALTATHIVYWNLEGLDYFPKHEWIVDSEQFATGYIIGTRGPAPAIKLSKQSPAQTDPPDHVEGLGRGGDLLPRSLYDDQLRRRLSPGNP